MTQMRKMMMFALSVLVLVSACSEGDKRQEPNAEDGQAAAAVTLSPQQYKASDIRLGQLSTAAFTGNIRANGSLRALPQDRAEVTSPMGATVRRILVVEGQRVARGQVLAWLSHPDLIALQGRYAQAKARLTYLAAEYQRQKALYAGKVGAGKDFQQVSAEYHALQGELRATAEQLRLMGISPSAVSGGRTVAAIALRSPISGTVERVAAALGQYADPQASLFSIVNTSRLFADLLVYERDFDRVRAGQRATLKAASSSRLSGRVLSVGRTLDDSSKAVHVRVAIDGGKAGLVAGMYVAGSIATSPQSAPAVPDEGVATVDTRSYVFVLKPSQGGKTFEPREVRTGRKEGGMTEILSGLSKGETIAAAGAYTLLSEWKKSEVGED